MAARRGGRCCTNSSSSSAPRSRPRINGLAAQNSEAFQSRYSPALLTDRLAQRRRQQDGWSPLEGILARKKTSLAEDLMDLVSLLPWWAGAVLAVISYVLLHRLATPPTTVDLQ